MKSFSIRQLFLIILTLIVSNVQAQNTSDVVLKDLAVPNSPAFLLMEVAPSNIQAPVNPKEFTLGLVQNFNVENKWFNDYSMEFTPYWWVKSSRRNAYNFLGLNVNDRKANLCSSAKLVSFSLGFITKDMVPDSSDLNQKIASFGIRLTVLKIMKKGYAKTTIEKMNKFLVSTVSYNDSIIAITSRIHHLNLTDKEIKDSAQKAIEIFQKEYYLNDQGIKKTVEEIRDLIEEKPIFNIDIAGALAEYGIGDTVWKTGRSGGWLTASSFIPLSCEDDNENYFDLLASIRFLSDQYVKSDEGKIGTSSLLDIGFKAGVEIHRFSLYGEGIWRSVSTQDDMQNRLTGILNYRIKDDLYLSGTYGTDFGHEKSIIALFGVNWGFGSEKVDISKPE
jgi:hypothetical protein